MRRKKRGPKTKKGRNRFHTDWKEPKLLILYVVGDDGATVSDVGPDHRRHAPGPEAVFALLLSYARQIGLNAADKVLFIADARPGSGDASSASSPRSGSRRHRCWG